VSAGDFVHSLQDHEEVALVSAVIHEERARQERGLCPPPAERYEQFKAYLQRRELQRRKALLLAAEHVPLSEEERLRAYVELRRTEDRAAAAWKNPHKEDR